MRVENQGAGATEPGSEAAGQKKALCGNRRPSNDCLPYENSSKDRCWCVGLHRRHKDNDPNLLREHFNDTKWLKKA